MEELKKVETEKTTRSIQVGPSNSKKQLVYLPSTIVGLLDPFNNWFLPSDFALSLRLFTDLRILKTIETSPNTQLGS